MGAMIGGVQPMWVGELQMLVGMLEAITA